MNKNLFTISFLFSVISIFSQTETPKKETDSIESNHLKEIQVVGKKKIYERKTDRLIFNVENSVAATGGDAVDVLKVTTGIKVQNDDISMIGKSGMSVMVNDRMIPLSGEALMNYLKTIPASNIKKIEVITAPPAKYDAQGNSGLINIVLKTTKIDSWNLNLRSSYTQKIYPSGNAGLDFNFKKDKLSLSSSLGVSKNRRVEEINTKNFYTNETWDKYGNIYQETSSINLDGNLSIDYDITKKWSLGAQYIGGTSGTDKTNPGNTSIYNLDNTVKNYMDSYGVGKSNSKSNSINIHSVHKIDSLGQNLSVDLDYFTYKNGKDTDLESNTYDANKVIIPNYYYKNSSNNNGSADNYSAKLDYELPTKFAKFDFGGKLSFSKTNNDYKLYDNSTGDFVLSTTQSNVFKYKENTQALYSNVNKKLSEKLELQLGLRMENTQTEGYSVTLDKSDENSYIKFFPTAYLSYHLSDENTFSLNYSKRIGRPNFELLNPFKLYVDQYTYQEGNPFLKPSFSNNLEFILTTKKFEHKLYGSYSTDEYSQTFLMDEATKMVKVFSENFITSYTAGISESYTFNTLYWWSSYNNVTAYYRNEESSMPNTFESLHTSSGVIDTNNDFILNKTKTVLFNISYYYVFPGINQLMKFEAMSSLSSGIRAILLDKKLVASLNFNDILKTQKVRISQFSNGLETKFFKYNDTQYFRLSLSYKFGNSKIQVDNRGVGNQDVINRVK